MREVHICEHDDEMSILKRLRDLFRKTQLTIADPVFGKIVYSPRSKQWFAENLSLKGKLNEVDQISIVADESGPTVRRSAGCCASTTTQSQELNSCWMKTTANGANSSGASWAVVI